MGVIAVSSPPYRTRRFPHDNAERPWDDRGEGVILRMGSGITSIRRKRTDVDDLVLLVRVIVVVRLMLLRIRFVTTTWLLLLKQPNPMGERTKLDSIMTCNSWAAHVPRPSEVEGIPKGEGRGGLPLLAGSHSHPIYYLPPQYFI
jgi:hypothetical protein